MRCHVGYRRAGKHGFCSATDLQYSDLFLLERTPFLDSLCSTSKLKFKSPQSKRNSGVLFSDFWTGSTSQPGLTASHDALPPIIMSQSVLDIDENFFIRSPSEGSGPPKNVDIPDSLQSATQRLGFPPSYVVVGVYRLLSDKALFSPVWQRCKSGFLRSAAVGGVWVCGHNIKLACYRRLTLPHAHSRF